MALEDFGSVVDSAVAKAEIGSNHHLDGRFNGSPLGRYSLFHVEACGVVHCLTVDIFSIQFY